MGMEGFNNQVKSRWNSFEAEGSRDFIQASKPKALKVKLKKWNLATRGNLKLKKNQDQYS